ncbi:hypothetical protein Y032_0249g106 [Ancylostoma ceylanicum]|uniref:Uncharacterized protein n=1 Tax=Ancylostoma ceylanicum TaxID=53326 RepID=A0A016SDB1_9BILA|nr:hypothetical protein Y032_0249g106 [Ancylostoma ceylanicum]
MSLRKNARLKRLLEFLGSFTTKEFKNKGESLDILSVNNKAERQYQKIRTTSKFFGPVENTDKLDLVNVDVHRTSFAPGVLHIRINRICERKVESSFQVGSPVVLDLQYPVRTWMRVTNDGYIEAARYCDRPTDAPECSQFVNVMTNETASPYSKVSVFPNGTLIFANLTVNDTGARYYSPEMRPKVRIFHLDAVL